jgi:hypothetical protein
MISGFAVALIAIPLIRWLIFRKSEEPATRLDGSLAFKPKGSVDAVYSIGLVAFSIAAILSLVNNAEWWVTAGFFGFVLFVMFSWPVTIVLSPRGIQAKRMIGWQKYISWPDLEEIEAYDNPLVLVLRQGKNKITYTSFHNDPRRFEDELRKYFSKAFKKSKHSHSE